MVRGDLCTEEHRGRDGDAAPHPGCVRTSRGQRRRSRTAPPSDLRDHWWGTNRVELAGALAELAKAALARDFRHIDPTTARIVLVEAGPRLLPSFPPKLSAVAARALTRLGVELRLGTTVTRCDRGGAVLDDEGIES